MRGRVDGSEQRGYTLKSLVEDLRDQLTELQAQQASMETLLTAQKSAIALRERVVEAREAHQAAVETRLALEGALRDRAVRTREDSKEEQFKKSTKTRLDRQLEEEIKQQTVITFHEYLWDGWAHYADNNIDRCLYWFNRAAELPGLEPELMATVLMSR